MAGDGVACLCCCGIPNGVARRNEALRTNNGYNATINLATRDDDADKTAKARAAAGRRWSVGPSVAAATTMTTAGEGGR